MTGGEHGSDAASRPDGGVSEVVGLLVAAAGEQEARGHDALARAHLLRAQQLVGALHRGSAD